MGSLGSGFAIFFQPIGRQETRAGAPRDHGLIKNRQIGVTTQGLERI